MTAYFYKLPFRHHFLLQAASEQIFHTHRKNLQMHRSSTSCFSSELHKPSSLNHGRATNRTHSFASPLFLLCFIYQVLQQFMLQLMQELKSKVTVLPSEKNICFSFTAVCPTSASHLVKPCESFLTLEFNT